MPGYVASEAYGVNNDRVVFGLLYDNQERTFPFRWEAGRMTVLSGPDGQRQQADVPDRNTINDRGEIAGTPLVAGQRQAVRWSPDGTATLLPALPGHTWTKAWSINGDGIVSGWSATSAPTPTPSGTMPRCDVRARQVRACWGAPLRPTATQNSWTSTTAVRRQARRAGSRRADSPCSSRRSGGPGGSQPRRHRGRRLRSHRQGVQRAPSHRPRPLDVPLRPVTA